MNRKAIIINVIILGLLAGFFIMSLIFYYLIPIGINIINFLQQIIEDFIVSAEPRNITVSVLELYEELEVETPQHFELVNNGN